nr:amidohydrolase family protein [Enterovibrio nigricans]
MRDLQGKTVTPGFIDAHGHFAQYLPLIENEFLYPAPMGDIGSIEDIDKKMRKYFARKDLDKRILHVAFGYDEALLLNSVGRHGSLKLFGS